MRQLLLILLMSACCACSATGDGVYEAEEFGDFDEFEGTTPADDGLYVDFADEPIGTTWAPWDALSEEWTRSVAGWSFTTRAVGRIAQRDWDRLFGSGH